MNYTFTYVNGVLTIQCNGVDTVVQPFDPNTQQPWADAATAEAWATSEIKNMQGTLSRKITTLALVRRFTLAEHAGILAAAQTVPTVRAIYDRLMLAKFIDLEDPDVKAGMEFYVTQNLLTEDRVTAILSAPVTEQEQP
ncbi:hypothetical protein [Ralstonia phage RP31]|uniref:Uncharacterized protein n=2 Tax=Ripduovirus RP12 TaxID=2560700 RepID=A0A1L7N1H8_9CAUD|nr:hypothetical protein FDH28_gp271 [Ralstonia phage RP12]BAW19124.1 hypothetical protein [Ralstonia phage RP12]BAW19410.1 hypothetical protein [Ralstonia phage RP31]